MKLFEKEWTGQFDRKGVKIMNGDRVKIPHFGEYGSREFEYTVVFSDGAFRLKADYKPVIILDKVTAEACKVIKPKEEKDSKYSEAIEHLNNVVLKGKMTQATKQHIETAIEVLEAADIDERIRADIAKAAKKDKPNFTELKERQKELYGRD